MRNKINESWSKIRPNAAADERMLSNILDRTYFKKSKREAKMAWKIYVPIAACVLIAMVLVVPIVIQNMAYRGYEYEILIAGDPMSHEGIDETQEPPENFQELPNLASQFYALTLNQASAQLGGARRFIPGHFWLDLTAEELQAVIPDLGFPMTARANFSGDGVLIDVSITEVLCETSMLWPASVQISTEGVYFGFIYDHEPVISYVHDIPVTAGVIEGIGVPEDSISKYIATFHIDGLFYGVSLFDYTSDGLNRLTDIVNIIIQNDAADLSAFSTPVIPELRDEALTLEAAHMDPDFGAFIPKSIPPGLGFESARRFINQSTNSLSVLWHAAMPNFDSISWRVSIPTEDDHARIVSVDEPEKFDLSLYPIPWMDSVPWELMQYVSNPVFLANELNLDVVRARLMEGRPQAPGAPAETYGRINFYVLFDDIIIGVDANGVSPEDVWEMFLGLQYNYRRLENEN